MFCANCGASVSGHGRFCATCGAPLSPPPASPYAATPPYAAPPAEAAPTPRSGRVLWIALFGCLGVAVLAIGAGIAAVALGLYDLRLDALPGVGRSATKIDPARVLRKGAEGAAEAILKAKATGRAAPALSVDQEMVKTAFGRPPAFRIVFAEAEKGPPVRIETWSFSKIGAKFIFKNGAFADSVDVPRQRAILRAKTPRPEQFAAGMSYQQVRALVGEDPVFQLDVPAVNQVLTAFHFPNGLVAGYEQSRGRLWFIEQLVEVGR